MWSTPSSIARRSTAQTPSRSRGGPNTPGPASCIAPKPMRLIGLSARYVVAFRGIAPDAAELEQLEAERLDLPDDAEDGGAVFEHAAEHGLTVPQLAGQRGKRGQARGPEPALDPDRVEAGRRGHDQIVPRRLVSWRRRD